MALKLVFNPFSGTFDYVDEAGDSLWRGAVATLADLPNPDADGVVRVTLDTKNVYEFDLDTTTWILIAGPGAVGPVIPDNELLFGDGTITPDSSPDLTFDGATLTVNGDIVADNVSGTNTGDVTLTAVGASPSANAASLAGQALTLQPADATNPGVLTSGTQSIGGNKTFTGTVAASNISGTNSGDVTLSAFGSSPSANAASLSGQALTLQPADATHPGGVSTTTQSFAGDKTVVGNIAANNLSGTNSGDVTLAAFGSVPNANGASLSGQALTLQPANATNPGGVSTASQTFAGIKTFSSQVNTDGGIDRSTSGTLTIGATNSTTINIGNSGATVNIQGTTIYENTPQLLVADPLITVNVGGGAGSGQNAGFQVEEAASITGYVETSLDRNSWLLKAPNTAGQATITPGSGGITLNQSSHDPLTLAAVGAVPNANGASLSSQALTLQPASGSFPGVVSTTTQTFAGDKTFTGNVFAPNLATTSTGDINQTSFSLANNQVALANVTGLLFSNASVRSAEIFYSVTVDATSDLFESGKIKLAQRGADWTIARMFDGDDSLVSFDVTNAGQVQYTTPAYSGFVSGTMKFRAEVTNV